MKSDLAPQGDTRVILHIDLDCFYAQVEQVRLGIPRDVPVAVQQWDGLIAVNYAARAKGITRHMRVGEAKLKCPELQTVHVETIGDASITAAAGGGSTVDPSKESNMNSTITGTGTIQEGNTSTGEADPVDRLTQKACLERYRRANSEILKILHKLAPTSVIEKASIDEVYIDVTAMVDAELQGKYNHSGDDGNSNDSGGGGGGGGDAGNEYPSNTLNTMETSPSDAFSWGSIVVSGPLDPGSEFDVRLACGAGIACRLRGAILEKLGYSSSAGIAANKLLAKIGSALHKPNQQTVIPSRGVAELMKDLPLKKVKNFGGRVGEKLEELFGVTTAGAVAAIPIEMLSKSFGAEKARWIVDAVHGRNNDPVEEKERPKSMLTAKSFSATSDTAALQRWIGILAAELAPRMATDEEMFRRRARTLSVHFRGGIAPGQDRTRQGAMPKFSKNGGVPYVETISCAAWEIFKTRCAGEALPCLRLGLSAGDFAELPVQGKSAITNFLVARKPGADMATTSEKGKEGDVREDNLNAGNERNSKRSLEYEEGNGDHVDKKVATAPRVPAAGADEEKKEKEESLVLPEGLSGVDIAEQRRLLKEATMLKVLADGNGKNRGTMKSGGSSGSGGGKKEIWSKGGGKGSGQGNIARFFTRKS